MNTRRSSIILLICSISLLFPLVIHAAQNQNIIDSLFVSGKMHLSKGRFDHAIYLFLNALKMAKDLEQNDQYQESIKLLAEAYENLGDYQTVNIYLKKFQHVQDSLFILELEKSNYIKPGTTKSIPHHEYVGKLESSKKQQFDVFFIIIIGILLLSSFIFILHNRRTKKRMQMIIDNKTNDLKEANLLLRNEIAEKIENEEELKISKERYKQLIRNSPSLILEIDLVNLNIISCNPAMANSLGSTVEDLKGKSIKEILPEDIFKNRYKIAEAAIRNNEVVVAEDSNKGRYFYNTIIPVVSGEQKTLQIVSYDVTDRKRAEIELKEREALLQSLIFNIPLSFYARDKQGKIFMQSALSIQNWGDQAGLTVDDMDIDNSLKKTWKKWAQSALSGRSVKSSYTLDINGEKRYYKTYISSIKKDEEIIGMLGVDIDVTEERMKEENLLKLTNNLEIMVEDEVKKRKEQQELLVQKSKLESLGHLAAGIAHEINQPVGLMALGLDNVLEMIKNDKNVSAEYLKGKIDKFFKYIDRIRQIIDHIGTFSRDQRDIIFDEINVNTVVVQAVDMTKKQYADRNISFIFNLDEDIPLILGNSYKIEQVFLNLLSNSYDALELRSKNEKDYQKKIKINTYKGNKSVIVEFIDNGIGIFKKDIESIFDPFYTTKGPDRGTGLGLSISYGILEEMDAQISVESKPKEFTKFTLTFKKV